MVASTALAVLLGLFILGSGPGRGLLILFLTMPFGAAAAYVSPGVGNVTLADACVLALWVSVLTRLSVADVISGFLPWSSGFALALLAMIAVIGAVFLPAIFMHSTEVYAVVARDGKTLISPVALHPGSGQMAQLARLLLAVSAFFATAAIVRKSGDWRCVFWAITFASGAHILISVADWLTFPLGLSWLLDPVRTVHQAILVDQQFPGVRRLIGGHTEPARFGLYTMGLYGVWLRLWVGARFGRLAGVLAIFMAVLAIRSTSTATVANLLVFTSCLLLWAIAAGLASARRIPAFLIAIALLPAATIGLQIWVQNTPSAFELWDALFASKAGSASGLERLSWNRQAVQNFWDSDGLGLGIGSVRASSWIVSVLGNMGVPGVCAFGWFLWCLFRPGAQVRVRQDQVFEICAALRWGCFAIVLQSMLTKPYPDLGLAFFAMAGAATGLTRHWSLRKYPAPKIMRLPKAQKTIGAGIPG